MQAQAQQQPQLNVLQAYNIWEDQYIQHECNLQETNTWKWPFLLMAERAEEVKFGL
jgi:hypothetical protein